MPLWDGRAPDRVEPADAVAVVHAFLERCRDWALQEELPRRHRLVGEHWDAGAAAELAAWAAYLQYTRYALAELESGALDHWFRSSDPRSQTGKIQ